MKWDMNALDWRALFGQMHPDFFATEHIRALPEDGRWDEMALDLRGFSPQAVEIPVPGGVTFGFWTGDAQALRAVVRRVDTGWPELFGGEQPAYCAFVDGRVAAFCLVEDMCTFQGLRVGGPGCVGTLPEFRRQGIGLKMVQNATALLRDRGFDLSYIHYTGVASWYAKLGYRTVLRWGREGFV